MSELNRLGTGAASQVITRDAERSAGSSANVHRTPRAESTFGCIVDEFATELDSNIATTRQEAIGALYRRGAALGLSRSEVDSAIAAYDKRKYATPSDNRDHDGQCAARDLIRVPGRPFGGNHLAPIPRHGSGIQLHQGATPLLRQLDGSGGSGRVTPPRDE